MIPLNMLPKIGQSLPLPSAKIAEVKAHIQQRLERLESIKIEVLEQLAENANEAKEALDNFVQLLSADDPNLAVRPQLENLTRSLSDIHKIRDAHLTALRVTEDQIANRTAQSSSLKQHLDALQRKPLDSQAMSFVKELGSDMAAYAAQKGK